MQQGLTHSLQGDFKEIFPLKINARKTTLKVTYKEWSEPALCKLIA